MSNPANVIQLVLAKYHAGTVAPLLARIVQLESKVAEALECIAEHVRATERERTAALERVASLEGALDSAVRERAATFKRVVELEAEVQRMARVMERGHRGAYQPGALYERGEQVTRNGSSWVALVDDPKEGPPGDGRSWRMVAQGFRRGANGKGADHENA